jgi:hypothetical protein
MAKPWQAIVVTSGGAHSAHAGGARRRIQGWLAERGWQRVTVTQAAELAAAFPAVSAHTRRQALRESGLVLDPLVAGVVQDDLDHLATSLLALAGVYVQGARHEARALVIEAREHAEWAANNPRLDHEKRAIKREMVLWLRTWLDNPPLFATWVALRRRRLAEAPS